MPGRPVGAARPRGDGGRSLGDRPALVVLLAVAVLVTSQVLAQGVVEQEWWLLDLDVYRMGGQAVIDGASLYSLEYHIANLPFLYPPFAAVVFVPWALLGAEPAAIAWTALSLLALARSCQLLARKMPLGATGLSAATVAVALFVMAILSEPVRANLGFGQINLVIMWLVLEDLLGRSGRKGDGPPWSRGVLVGLAAGLKLTPGAFAVLLALTGRVRQAVTAVVVAAGTLVLGFVVLPGESWRYWTEIAYEDSRVGVAYVGNQSINGFLARSLGVGEARGVHLALAGLALLAGLLAGRRLWARGVPIAAVASVAVAVLLASPLSWTHHWVWAIVVVAACIEVALASPQLPARVGAWCLAAATVATTMSDVVWWAPFDGTGDRDHRGIELVAANAYLWLGLVVLSAAVVLALTAPRRVGQLPSQPPEPASSASGRGDQGALRPSRS